MNLERNLTLQEKALDNPRRRYNISITYVPGWRSQALPSSPPKNFRSQLFPFLNESADPLTRMLCGAVFGREILVIPEFPIRLGTSLPPDSMRRLSYQGELLSDTEMRSHVRAHEVGHAAMHRDLAAVLQQLVPGNELQFMRAMQLQAEISRANGYPLTMVAQLHNYDTPEKKIAEDLAEMYAIRLRASGNSALWESYKKFVSQSNPHAHMLFAVIEQLFQESQKGEHTGAVPVFLSDDKRP